MSRTVLEYIATKSGTLSAKKANDAILAAITGLTEMPDRHVKVKEALHRKDITYRRVIVNRKYRVIYKIEEPEKDVYVVRILHVKRGPDFVKKHYPSGLSITTTPVFLR